MKLLTIYLVLTLSLFAQGKTCNTYDGTSYECGDAKSLICAVQASMKPFKSQVYKFDIETVSNNTTNKIRRHFTSYTLDGQKSSGTYFVNYILNDTKGVFHLYHYIKNEDGKFDLYGDRDQALNKSVTTDLSKTSDKLEYVGTLETVTFDQHDVIVFNSMFTESGVYQEIKHDGENFQFSMWDDKDGNLIFNELYTHEYDIVF